MQDSLKTILRYFGAGCEQPVGYEMNSGLLSENALNLYKKLYGEAPKPLTKDGYDRCDEILRQKKLFYSELTENQRIMMGDEFPVNLWTDFYEKINKTATTTWYSEQTRLLASNLIVEIRPFLMFSPELKPLVEKDIQLF